MDMCTMERQHLTISIQELQGNLHKSTESVSTFKTFILVACQFELTNLKIQTAYIRRHRTAQYHNYSTNRKHKLSTLITYNQLYACLPLGSVISAIIVLVFT